MGVELRFKLKPNETLKSSTSVKTRTHSSNDPTLSLTEVKFLSKPTVTSASRINSMMKLILYIALLFVGDVPSVSTISTDDTSGLIIMFNLCPEVSLSVKCRLNVSVSSRISSSVILTSKHCLKEDELEVKFTRGLLEKVISTKSASST